MENNNIKLQNFNIITKLLLKMIWKRGIIGKKFVILPNVEVYGRREKTAEWIHRC